MARARSPYVRGKKLAYGGGTSKGDHRSDLGRYYDVSGIGDKEAALTAAGSTLAGVGAGAATGAAIGTAGGPIGWGVGAIVGGAAGLISGLFSGRKKKRARQEAESQRRKQYMEAVTGLQQQDEQSYADYMGNATSIEDTRYYASGGMIKPMSSDMSVAVGASHEQGGIQYGNDEVEGGEVIEQVGSSTDPAERVFSEELGFAPVAEKYGLAKAQLESALQQDMMKQRGLLDQAENSNNIEKRNTYRREAEKITNDMTVKQAQIKEIDMALDELFMQQELMAEQMGLRDEQGMPTEEAGMPTEQMGSTEDPYRGEEAGLSQYRFGGVKGRKLAGGGLSSAQGWGLAANLAGSLGDYVSTRGDIEAFEGMRTSPKLRYNPQYIDKHVDTTTDLNAIDDAVAKSTQYISSNTSNPIVARNAMRNANSQGARAKSEVANKTRATRKNIEATNVQANNQASMYNIESLKQYNDELNAHQQHALTLRGENNKNLITNIGEGIQSYREMDMENRMYELLLSDKPKEVREEINLATRGVNDESLIPEDILEKPKKKQLGALRRRYPNAPISVLRNLLDSDAQRRFTPTRAESQAMIDALKANNTSIPSGLTSKQLAELMKSFQ